jgi:hypothetical protein
LKKNYTGRYGWGRNKEPEELSGIREVDRKRQEVLGIIEFSEERWVIANKEDGFS